MIWSAAAGRRSSSRQLAAGGRGEPRPEKRRQAAAVQIRRVVVIGSGTMGGGIAAHFANARIPVYLLDISQQIVTASLDRLKIPNKEQKELLAIIESTRPEIVTER